MQEEDYFSSSLAKTGFSRQNAVAVESSSSSRVAAVKKARALRNREAQFATLETQKSEACRLPT